MKLTVSLLLLASSAIASAANVEDWLKSGLLHPDVIVSVRDELALTEEQQSRLNAQLGEARQQALPLEQAVKDEQKALGKLLNDTSTTAAAASASLARLLEAEAAVKQLQLRTLIAIRDVLTPEQLKKAKKLGPPKMAGAEATEAVLMQKTAKLKAALESLGIPPTEAMKARGAEIETLIRTGEMKAANAALDKLIEDGRINELEAEADEIDFSKYEPGSTDLESLKERYEDVQGRGQSIVSLPLMRDLLQAKAAFEEAKAAQDADKVGRILTYVEGKLKP
jgi:Spy/CpxP family protein refolding chaperone